MAQLDYFMRDWRRNGLISMSDETIDLMWELHQELGSKVPIRIICGFRSAETNALLKRIGRHVATRSQHILGRAIDLQFPDVPLERLRNSALVRQAGGVGYYPGGGGGFVHIDSGNVRHWPWISKAKLNEIFAEYTGSTGKAPPLPASQMASNEERTATVPAPRPKPKPEPSLERVDRPLAGPGHDTLVASDALRSSSSSASTAIGTGLTGGRGAGKSASEGPWPSSRASMATASGPQ
jgi:hypothetical protein